MEAMMMKPGRKKIHPYKFILWTAIGSILMMFAGLTSAYMVKRNQANWQGFDLPPIFIYSTVVIIVSSITIQLALKKRKMNLISASQNLVLVTALLGAAFIAMQCTGFMQLDARGIKLIGQGSNVSGSFLAVIVGLHLLHLLGGVIALFIIYAKTYLNGNKQSSMSLEVVNQYWHFVDFLWVYLFVFLLLVS